MILNVMREKTRAKEKTSENSDMCYWQQFDI